MIIIKLFLHGKPNWYLPLEGTTKVNPNIIRLYADQLKEHLYKASLIADKLQKMGWFLLKSYGTVYYLEYCKFDIVIEEAKKELTEIGINNQVIIEELNLENVC